MRVLTGYLARQRATLLRVCAGLTAEEFHGTDPDRARQDVAALQAEWSPADAAVAALPLDHEIDFRGHPMSLRMAYLHVIGEYARHNGHADLLRDAIDGVTGR